MIDINDINEGIVYIEGGVGKYEKGNSPNHLSSQLCGIAQHDKLQ